MDVILQALDTINAQFAQQAREDISPADDKLLELLHKLSQPSLKTRRLLTPSKEAEPEPEPEAPKEEAAESSGDGGIDEIQDDEFEAYLMSCTVKQKFGVGKSDQKADAPKAAADQTTMKLPMMI